MCTRLVYMHVDFPDGSDVKASAYNVEDLGSIPGGWEEPLEKGKA